jgi:hypothetical protein
MGGFDKVWSIPLSSLSNHLNGKRKFRKMGLGGVLIVEEDNEVIKWALVM